MEQNVLTVHATRPGIDGDVELLVGERPTGAFTRQVFLGDTLDRRRRRRRLHRRRAHPGHPGPRGGQAAQGVEITSQDTKQISPA